MNRRKAEVESAASFSVVGEKVDETNRVDTTGQSMAGLACAGERIFC